MSTTAQRSSSFDAKGRNKSPLDKGKQSQTTEPLNERQSSPDSKTMSQGEETEATKVQNSMKARKRTKTGCLTCRKRRIKCGEERPTCANCIKSKRGCEGYAPRLTFKDPLGAVRPGYFNKGSGAFFQDISSSSGAAGQYPRLQTGSASQAQFPAIAPRPLIQTPHDYYSPAKIPASNWPLDEYSSYANTFNHAPPPFPPPGIQTYPGHDGPTVESNNCFYVPSLPENPPQAVPHLVAQSSSTETGNRNASLDRPKLNSSWSQSSITAAPQHEYTQNSTHVLGTPVGYEHSRRVAEYPSQPLSVRQSYGEHIDMHRHLAQHPDPIYHHTDETQSDINVSNWDTVGGMHVYTDRYGEYNAENSVYQDFNANNGSYDDQAMYGSRPSILSHTVEAEDDIEDEYYDVNSDEEDAHLDYQVTSTPQHNLNLVLALSASQNDSEPRWNTSFSIAPNLLSSYQPRYIASPLMELATARIFYHFITIIGPSLSVYERHLTNPAVVLTGAPVPASQQSLWTYTLPMIALSNQALLQAMLALASLHIAKLQKAPLTASLRHYHYAIRRVAKAVSSPSKRTEIATIAATLILSFYEVTTAEHSKWNSHLIGARQLLMEVDFRGTQKRIKDEKTRSKGKTYNASWNDPHQGYMKYPACSYATQTSRQSEIDFEFVGRLMGKKLQYDHHGNMIEEGPQGDPLKVPMTTKDIENFQVYVDLFWWYCKQDVYQGIISGNRLLLPYHHWDFCPPRAPVGRLDAIYGTMDHLVLLMGRVADFNGKDQLRKRKVVEANGGQWRPPGMPPQRETAKSTPQPASQPQMYGMAPPAPPRSMPPAFTQAPRDKLYLPTKSTGSIDLDKMTREAEIEWEEIQSALEAFEQNLTLEFQPLSSDMAPPKNTPFGDTIEFRAISISCIWTMYYMGRIIAARMHPTMPPAAMMAAGVAAQRTAHWATMIGRISAGMQPSRSNQPLNPSLGAALMESTLPMFFAAVQYQSLQQRHFIVSILRNIAEITGWETSAVIANGCEQAWSRMHEAGSGPPYQQYIDLKTKDDRMLEATPYARNTADDRRLFARDQSTRVHYGLGILSIEEDFKELSIKQ